MGYGDTGYERWGFEPQFICSHSMVPVDRFIKMLNKIFPSLDEEDIYDLPNQMLTIDPPSKTVRFPENGYFIMLGDKTIAEKMDLIRANLKLIKTIQNATSTCLESVTVMKQALESLHETVTFLRDHISYGRSVYNQCNFENTFNLKWKVGEYSDDDY